MRVPNNEDVVVDADNDKTSVDEEDEDEEEEEEEDCSFQSDGNSHSTSSPSSQKGFDDDNTNRFGDDSRSGETYSRCEYKQVRDYASKETQRVQVWRIVVLLSILIAGTVVATLTFVFMTNENEQHDSDTFHLQTNRMEVAFTNKMKSLYETQKALGLLLTTNVVTKQNNFPFVAVPMFEVHAHTARIEAGIEELIYAPIVPNKDYNRWIKFTNKTKTWLDESKIIFDQLEPGSNRSTEPKRNYIPPLIFRFDTKGNKIPWNGIVEDDNDNDNSDKNDNNDNNTTSSSSYFCPRLYTSPPPSTVDGICQNEDMFSNSVYRSISTVAAELQGIVISAFNPGTANFDNDFWYSMIHPKQNVSKEYKNALPYSITAQPVFNNLNDSTKYTIGFIFSMIHWENYILEIGSFNEDEIGAVDGVDIILRNSCNQSHTFQFDYGKLIYVGDGDQHDHKFEDSKRTITFDEDYLNVIHTTNAAVNCRIYLDVYPSSDSDDNNGLSLPIILVVTVCCVFVAMAGVFFMYDRFVHSRNDKLISAAARSNAIVSSLFPSNVRDRLLAEKENEEGNYGRNDNNNRSTLKGFLAGETVQDTEMQDEDVYKSKPIADLFPETTVMFGDIVGFTAWSSVREPTQVFTLLETIYHAFDEIARRRRVFKVETVGDCYVAVCGLPDPRKDHAVNMCRFARDCMYRLWELTKKLEIVLGPDTGDLSMRVGLHSGPVTAGVLRGERSRFQLFGDTMNTAARMESNGKKSRIHLSQETADLVLAAGKTTWVTAREDKIIAKGKGEMQTYWLELTDKVETGSNGSGGNGKDSEQHIPAVPEKKITIDGGKTARLIEWNVEVLLRLLRQVVARRIVEGGSTMAPPDVEDLMLKPARGQTVLDEVSEIITLPQIVSTSMKTIKEIDAVELSPKVAEQLHDYVCNIASMYRHNHFHNFEHASHVTMSVVKLLSRIVAPSENDRIGIGEDASSLHDHTYGITSDPLTQFSCVLSALIHDLDHPGVPNAQLVKENSQMASVYKNKSIAEQNSVDIAWHLLTDERYDDLRHTIYTNETEMKRFRQLVVNSVMATDIVDKELKNLRNARWEKAFSDSKQDEDNQVTINRKATIVIEHLIQASDVAHTMQHWHIYRKWNQRFFMECYNAFKDGRAETDPSINWYKGEIGFFDFYIIPLAKKLKNCGVFGVSSDEYLNYAMANRQEWEQKGQDIVAEMIEKVNSEWTESH